MAFWALGKVKDLPGKINIMGVGSKLKSYVVINKIIVGNELKINKIKIINRNNLKINIILVVIDENSTKVI